jgi:hypothetical protein
MLRFFVDLKKQRTTAKFLIVSTDKVDLRNYEMRKDVIHTQVARKLVPLYISIANLAVCFIKPTFSKKASSATKIGEILTMDVPIMVNNGWGDIADIVKKSLIHPSPFPKEFYQINSSDLIIEYFDLNSGIAEYSITYNKLITE